VCFDNTVVKIVSSVLVIVTVVGVVASTLIYDYYIALSFWYLEPGEGHFDRVLAKQYGDV
jgi:hypothetical protein